MSRHRHKIYGQYTGIGAFITQIWDGFWNPPEAVCPKCGSVDVEWYDSFLFNPVRTMNGKRRYRCKACRFVWRKSRGATQSLLTKVKQSLE